MKEKPRLRKTPKSLLDPPKGHGADRTVLNRAPYFRAEMKLRKLVEQTKFEEAKVVFEELIRTSKYAVYNTWQAGAEIIGHIAPELLAEYLKAIYVNSPIPLTPVTFNAYIDQLMTEKKWTTAIEEIEIVYERKIFNHLIYIRKIGVCAYHQWEESKNNLPEEYFDEYADTKDNHTVIMYKRHEEAARKHLPRACQYYIRDAEIAGMYLNFLTFTNDEITKQKFIKRALQFVTKQPNYHLLFLLIKMNENNVYFKSKPYITYLYEFDPHLDSSYGLLTYVKKTCKRIAIVDFNSPDAEKFRQRAAKLFQIFVFRTENNNYESWFLKKILQICQRDVSRDIYNYWKHKNVESLLLSRFLFKSEKERLDAKHLVALIKKEIRSFAP